LKSMLMNTIGRSGRIVRSFLENIYQSDSHFEDHKNPMNSTVSIKSTLLYDQLFQWVEIIG